MVYMCTFHLLSSCNCHSYLILWNNNCTNLYYSNISIILFPHSNISLVRPNSFIFIVRPNSQISYELPNLDFSIRYLKELSFCHKLCLANPDIFATWCCRPLIFQTMISVRSNNLILKYQGFTPSGCKDIGLRTFKFVANTQFLYIFMFIDLIYLFLFRV